MIKIAITGNIAAGKTQVENYLKNYYPVVDTDILSHKILENKAEIIKKTFKNYDIIENNIISRKKLGNLIFENEEHRFQLESIIHPEIKKEIEHFFDNNKNAQLSFVSIPLLFEAKMDNLFDKIIFIYADDNIRLKRLMERNNLSQKEALLRLNSQISQEEKIKKSDFVIKNDSTLDYLYKELDKIIKSILVF